MSQSLVARIKKHVQLRELQYGVATQAAIRKAEVVIGFSIPPLLASCYLDIGNGGFGPGYGIIGVEGGQLSDYGDISETYTLLKSEQEREGRIWQRHVLPFCEWGCNIFSCVECCGNASQVWTFEDFGLWPEVYTLPQFFEMWIDGVDILSANANRDVTSVKGKSPFTKQDFTFRRAKRRDNPQR